MNALEFLKADHRRINQLFGQMEEASDFQEKKAVYEEVRDLLTLHAELEERFFYPLFVEREGFVDLIEDAYDEHAEFREILAELEGLVEDEARAEPHLATEDEFDIRMEELMDSVEHHVSEEEGELMLKVEQRCSRLELEELGDCLQKERERFTRQAA